MSHYCNRYFKHKFFKNNVVVANMEKDEQGLHHLYVSLVEGDEIKGMSGTKRFMLSTTFHQDNWKEQTEEFMKNNQYEEFNPHAMTQEEAQSLLEVCFEKMREVPDYRLGQAIINELGEKTPTPNPQIFYEKDEAVVYDWFYSNCVKSAAEVE